MSGGRGSEIRRMSKLVAVRFTPAQRKRFQALAEASGATLAVYARELIDAAVLNPGRIPGVVLARHASPAVVSQLAGLAAEIEEYRAAINTIGVSINDQAHRANCRDGSILSAATMQADANALAQKTARLTSLASKLTTTLAAFSNGSTRP